MTFDPGGRLMAFSTTDTYLRPHRGWIVLYDSARWLEVGRMQPFPEQRIQLIRLFRGGLVCCGESGMKLLVAAAPDSAAK